MRVSQKSDSTIKVSKKQSSSRTLCERSHNHDVISDDAMSHFVRHDGKIVDSYCETASSTNWNVV